MTPHALDLEPIAGGWQHALDADSRALDVLDGFVPPGEIARRRSALALERREVRRLLTQVSRTTWLADVPVTTRALGVPDGSEACVFDLDGVLTDSGVLHAWAWAETFDPFLLQLSERTGWSYRPFDRDADYAAYLDGRPRLDGIHAFLESRGVRPDAETARGLARRKNDVLTREMHRRGVAALDGAVRYLEAAGRARVGRAVVSASTRTLPMLELAGLDTLIDARVDAEAIGNGLRPRPAPDLLIAACERLDVRPERAVTLTHTPAGMAAGRSAGLLVIGVAGGDQGELLRGLGVERVVPCLGTLLDPRVVPTQPHEVGT